MEKLKIIGFTVASLILGFCVTGASEAFAGGAPSVPSPSVPEITSLPEFPGENIYEEAGGNYEIKTYEIPNYGQQFATGDFFSCEQCTEICPCEDTAKIITVSVYGGNLMGYGDDYLGNYGYVDDAAYGYGYGDYVEDYVGYDTYTTNYAYDGYGYGDVGADDGYGYYDDAYDNYGDYYGYDGLYDGYYDGYGYGDYRGDAGKRIDVGVGKDYGIRDDYYGGYDDVYVAGYGYDDYGYDGYGYDDGWNYGNYGNTIVDETLVDEVVAYDGYDYGGGIYDNYNDYGLYDDYGYYDDGYDGYGLSPSCVGGTCATIVTDCGYDYYGYGYDYMGGY